MKFCENCGAQLSDGTAFCPECGTPVEDQQPVMPPRAPEPPAWEEPVQHREEEAPGDALRQDAQRRSALPEDEGAEGHKLMSALCYLGVLVVIPLILDKKSAYTQFHANQGLALLIAGLLAQGAAFVAKLMGSGLLGVIASAAMFALGILGLIGIYNAVTGKVKELPVLGKYRILK